MEEREETGDMMELDPLEPEDDGLLKIFPYTISLKFRRNQDDYTICFQVIEWDIRTRPGGRSYSYSFVRVPCARWQNGFFITVVGLPVMNIMIFS